MPVTLEAAREAKEALVPHLHKLFNSYAKSPVNGIGIAADGQDYFVKVNLLNKPDSKEFILLPRIYKGVKVKYETSTLPSPAKL